MPETIGHGCGTGADGDLDCVETANEKTGRTPDQVKLESFCKTQLREKNLWHDSAYADRLEYELSQIAEQGEAPYLIGLLRRCRAEGVQFGNENGLLVEWLLGITKQDPVREKIPHRFKFFGDAPDIDLDFDSVRKQEVEDYLKHKYGEDHVVHIGAYGTFSAKSSLKEMARVHGLMETGSEEESWISRFAKEFDPFEPASKETMDWNLAYVFNEGTLRTTGEAGEAVEIVLPPSPWTEEEISGGKRFYEKHKDVFDLAAKVNNQITHFTAHAAGVGIFPKPAWLHMPLKWNPKKGQIQTAMQEGMRHKEITKAGIIKIDVLGLTLNSVIAMALRLIHERHGLDLWDLMWPRCPSVTRRMLGDGQPVLDINDAKMLEEARKGHNVGSFQFAGAGITHLMKRIHPDSFEDIVAANALYRPGTIKAGEAEAFAWRKARIKHQDKLSLSVVEKQVLAEGYAKDEGRRKQKYADLSKLHPAFKELLSGTHGTLAYQEQVMTTFADVAGFNMQEADNARKTLLKAAQSTDREEKLAGLYAKAARGASEKGMDKGDVKKLISVLASFSGYSFNKSHSASYALAYAQVQFLKIYYPIEFIAALLSFSKNSTATKKREDDPDLHLHIKEARRLGTHTIRPLCNYAREAFTIHRCETLRKHMEESDSPQKSLDGEVPMWGLQHLLGVGEKQAHAIVATYPVEDLEDFCERVDQRVVNKNVQATLARIGFFDSLYEDEPDDMRRVLAWRHLNENRNLVTMDTAVQQVRGRYFEIENQIASLLLTPDKLERIENIEKKAREGAATLRQDGKPVTWLHKRKREMIDELDPNKERKTLKVLLREKKECVKLKHKLQTKPQDVVYSELCDDIPHRVEAERQVYGTNMYTNALKPYMPQVRKLANCTTMHYIAIPEIVHKTPPRHRKCMTMVGEMQSANRFPYSDKSGGKKMRLMAKLVGRDGVALDVVAFNVGDDMWNAARYNLHKVVAVTGRLGSYNGKPQIIVEKNTSWLKRSGIEPFEDFFEAYSGYFKRGG